MQYGPGKMPGTRPHHRWFPIFQGKRVQGRKNDNAQNGGRKDSQNVMKWGPSPVKCYCQILGVKVTSGRRAFGMFPRIVP